MRAFRRNRRPGNRPPTAEEAARIEASKVGPCCACVVYSRAGKMPRELIVYGCDYNHAKSGNIRRGHLAGYALCIYHHRRHPLLATIPQTAKHYGPSLLDGSRLFHSTYGDDDSLVALQDELLTRSAA